jgi:fidgetin-like protein 1
LASRTEFYSYSDLDALCRTAALIPLRSVGRSQVSKITASDLRPINMDDFDEALQNVKPSLNQENRERLLEFARKYAQIT